MARNIGNSVSEWVKHGINKIYFGNKISERTNLYVMESSVLRLAMTNTKIDI